MADRQKSLQKRPLSWHQINEQAAQRAGNSAIVRNVANVYRRYPGLNVLMVERLSHVDFDASSLKQRSQVYGIDSARFEGALGRLLQEVDHSNPHRGTQIAAMRDYALKEIDSGRASYFKYSNNFMRENIRDHHKGPANQRPMNALVFEHGETLTRNEIVARFASLPTNQVNVPDDVTLAEIHRFICAHELQHGRNHQTYDYAFFGPSQTNELEEIHPNYNLLKRKFEGQLHDGNGRDAFESYIDETMADTAATLHHIKAGGSISLVKAIAEARASAFVENADRPKAHRIYASHTVLDKLIEHEELFRDTIENTPENELDVLAAGLVGDFAWGRTEYYKNACAANLAKARDIQGKALIDEECRHTHQILRYGRQAQLMCEYGHLPYGIHITDELIDKELPNFGVTDQLVQKVKDRSLQGQQYLQARGPVSAEQHLVEVRAMVKYNQNKHPEFAGPKGEQHLLGIRERCIAAPEHKVLPHPEESKILAILKEETAHRAKQEHQPELGISHDRQYA